MTIENKLCLVCGKETPHEWRVDKDWEEDCSADKFYLRCLKCEDGVEE